ncbi:hypothetical protein FB446DRAFT_72910 [Lentinula raphanica]|nr:hypothetical protein FB446DRAFT_72910 [Lentinula raphanica]
MAWPIPPQTSRTFFGCFMNPAMFQRNIKIRKAEAASVIMRSTKPRDVAEIFRDHYRSIHEKAVPEDPNFLRTSVACGKIEQWCEHNFPSFVRMQSSSGSTPTFDPEDDRTSIPKKSQETKQRLEHHTSKIYRANPGEARSQWTPG